MKAPRFWLCFTVEFLGIPASLARELWRVYAPSQAVLYQMGLIERRIGGPANVEHFGELLSPMDLMRLCVKLSPEKTGKPRRRDVLAAEEAILRMTKDGRWR